MDIQYLMRQAKKLEKAMADAKEQLGDMSVEAESGGGAREGHHERQVRGDPPRRRSEGRGSRGRRRCSRTSSPPP